MTTNPLQLEALVVCPTARPIAIDLKRYGDPPACLSVVSKLQISPLYPPSTGLLPEPPKKLSYRSFTSSSRHSCRTLRHLHWIFTSRTPRICPELFTLRNSPALWPPEHLAKTARKPVSSSRRSRHEASLSKSAFFKTSGMKKWTCTPVPAANVTRQLMLAAIPWRFTCQTTKSLAKTQFPSWHRSRDAWQRQTCWPGMDTNEEKSNHLIDHWIKQMGPEKTKIQLILL